MGKLLMGVAAAVFAWAGQSAAQQLMEEGDLALAYGDKNLVSIATGTRQLVRKAPSVTTVITAADIAAMGATTLEDVMETVPGVHVGHASNSAYPQFIFRGIFSNYTPQVLILENGVPMTSQFLGDRGLIGLGLPLEHVDRIEVIRGPGSALYGADAFAGVINIITRPAGAMDRAEAGVRVGSFDTWDAWLSHGARLGALSIAGHIRLGGTDGHRKSVREDLQSQLDGLFAPAPAASLAPGPLSAGRRGLDANLDLVYGRFQWRLGYRKRDDVGTFAGVGNALDPRGESRMERTVTDLSWHDEAFARDLAVTLRASYSYYEEFSDLTVFPPGASGGAFPEGMIGNPYKWERQTRFSASAVYSGLARHRVRIGLGRDDLQLHKTRETKNFTFSGLVPTPTPGAEVIDFSETAPFLRPQNRRVNYAYVQDEWNFTRDWTLTAGVRHDRYSDFGGTTNPRLALVWEARHDLTAKLMYGSAFRAPSFAEAHSINNPVHQGNPDLRPEEIDTFEAAVSWAFLPDARMNLSLFRHRMKDIIRLVANANPATGSTQQNIGEQTGKGGELEVFWEPSPGLHLSGHYAYQENIDEATGLDAGYAPRHQAYARAWWRVAPGLAVSPQLNHVAGRKRAFGDDRPPIPDYTTVDVTLLAEAARGWHWAASVRNLFDADVREPSLAGSGIPHDLPMPGRSFWLQAGYRM